MSDMAKEARAAMKSKAKRLGTTDPHQKVDASSWTPPEPLNADVKTGLRPLSRRAFKKGGKVMGECGPMRADRKPRKSGGMAVSPAEYAKAKINRNVKDANEERSGKKHVGGMNKGGRAGYKTDGKVRSDRPVPAETLNKMTTPQYREELENTSRRTMEQRGNPPDADDLYDDEGLRRLERGYKKGGRAKKMDGGIMMGDPRMGIVQPKRLTFGNALVTPGQKRGGKVSKHSDEAMDKALIRKMVKKEARTGKARGGMKLDGELQGTRPTGGRKARADGGNMPTAQTTATTTSAPTTPTYPNQSRMRPATASTPLPTRQYSSDTRQYTPAENQQRAVARYQDRLSNEEMHQKAHDARIAAQQARRKQHDAYNEARKGMNVPGTAENAAKLAGLLKDKGPAKTRYAKEGGRIKKFGGGALEYAQGGMPSRGGSPAPGMMGRPQMGRGYGGGRGMQGYGNDMLYPGQFPPGTGGPSVPAPVTGGGYPPVPQTGGFLPQYNPQQPQAFKRGGNVKKGKTNINIIIASGKQKGEPEMPAPVPPPPGAMPPPNMPPGPPPGGAPPMPPMPPMGGPPGMPPGMPPMPRKAGGRITKTAHSYKDMQAGAGSGEGRLQKSEIAAYQREGRKHGGKAYHSFKDLTAGAGSGEGRLQKTDIAAYKRSAKP